MDANQNPPSERDWTDQEKDEFYASIGLSGTPINKEPFRPSASITYCGDHLAKEWEENPPTVESIKKIMDWWNQKSIPDGARFVITSIVPPEQGWPIVAHCDLCKKTVIVLSPWAIKPSDGDYWKMNGTCLDEDLHIKHNMYPQKWYPWGDGKIKFQVHDLLPLEGMEIYMRSNHISTPYDLDFTQEMPIEEAKKRWPNTPEGE